MWLQIYAFLFVFAKEEEKSYGGLQGVSILECCFRVKNVWNAKNRPRYMKEFT